MLFANACARVWIDSFRITYRNQYEIGAGIKAKHLQPYAEKLTQTDKTIVFFFYTHTTDACECTAVLFVCLFSKALTPEHIASNHTINSTTRRTVNQHTWSIQKFTIIIWFLTTSNNIRSHYVYIIYLWIFNISIVVIEVAFLKPNSYQLNDSH